MNGFDGIFDEWVEEASQEVSRMGWRDASMNALLLLCHAKAAKTSRNLEKWLKGPTRWFLGVMSTSVVWLIVRDLLLHMPE